MGLSSLHLDAFFGVAQEKSFSKAAKNLGLTQSALSQRVLNLEQELGSTLFIREASGIHLTELGERLLRYCQTRNLLEDEFLSYRQTSSSEQISGVIRLSSFSTVSRTVVLPSLLPITKEYPNITLDLKIKELRDLPGMLFSGASDFVVSTSPINKKGVNHLFLGYENNVLVFCEKYKDIPDVYLDHDNEDSTTFDFFNIQTNKIKKIEMKRHFLDDVDSIIKGVELGLGKAVLPLHLIKERKNIKIVPTLKPLMVPVYLNYYSQVYYTRLHGMVIQHVKTGFKNSLKS